MKPQDKQPSLQDAAYALACISDVASFLEKSDGLHDLHNDAVGYIRHVIKEHFDATRLPQAVPDRMPPGRVEHGWRERHAAHLLSPQWAELRRKVQERERSVCQGCGIVVMNGQCHHLTYKRLGAELLIDLAWLCRPCHEHIHADKLQRAL